MFSRYDIGRSVSALFQAEESAGLREADVLEGVAATLIGAEEVDAILIEARENLERLAIEGGQVEDVATVTMIELSDLGGRAL